jgi:hypothetical protein
MQIELPPGRKIENFHSYSSYVLIHISLYPTALAFSSTLLLECINKHSVSSSSWKPLRLDILQRYPYSLTFLWMDIFKKKTSFLDAKFLFWFRDKVFSRSPGWPQIQNPTMCLSDYRYMSPCLPWLKASKRCTLSKRHLLLSHTWTLTV